MKATRRAALVGAMVLTSLSLAACNRSESPAGGAEGTADSAAPGAEAMDGLSRDEISRQVQPLSPDKAQELGIIDTTKQVETNRPGARVIPGTGQEVGPGDTL